MASYALDNLGWYQFEELIQSLLKSRFEAAVEAWGGHADWGRDAYYEYPLPFPDKTNKAPAPINFQVKFVGEANAAGADPAPAVLKAVRSELSADQKRARRGRRPRTYAFFTNAPLTATLRAAVKDNITERGGYEQVFPFGGQDISTWLNDAPNLRRAFPQLLSLRDLKELIAEVVEKPIIERSTVRLEESEELAKVFVPTTQYNEAWQRLASHGFVVLEGSPEVGKTAIARMIALTQFCNGWEAYECSSSQDVLQMYRRDVKQLFLADDAFGSNKYDVTAATQWARDLSAVLRRVNKSDHWLLWTARKHILEMAMKEAHLQGAGEGFPSPGDLLIDVGRLDRREKELILYRHAKAGGLSDKARALVKKCANAISHSAHFTPERIRRFISLRVESVAEAVVKTDDGKRLQAVVEEEIRSPTEAMQKSFRCLPPAHRTFLFAMLDAGPSGLFSRFPSKEGLRDAYERLRPSDVTEAFEGIHADMLYAFVRPLQSNQRSSGDLCWVHPSLADIVLEELAASDSLRLAFLSKCSIHGAKVALSRGAGETGERDLPLLRNQTDWEVLRHRLARIADTDDQSCQTACMAAIADALKAIGDPARTQLRGVATVVLEACCARWNTSTESLRLRALRAFYDLSKDSSQWVPSPNLTSTWDGAVESFREELENCREKDLPYEGSYLVSLLDFIVLCGEQEPRFLRRVGWPECLEAELGEALERIDGLASWVGDVGGEEANAQETMDNANSLSQSLAEAAEYAKDLKKRCEEIAQRLACEADGLEQRIAEMARQESPECDDWDREGPVPRGGTATVTSLLSEDIFSDL